VAAKEPVRGRYRCRRERRPMAGMLFIWLLRPMNGECGRSHNLCGLAILICLYSAMTNKMTITSRTVTASKNKGYC